jgi:hypothetical protein
MSKQYYRKDFEKMGDYGDWEEALVYRVMIPCDIGERHETMRKRLFHIARKLDLLLGLNEQELGWLKEYGADVKEAKR